MTLSWGLGKEEAAQVLNRRLDDTGLGGQRPDGAKVRRVDVTLAQAGLLACERHGKGHWGENCRYALLLRPNETMGANRLSSVQSCFQRQN